MGKTHLHEKSRTPEHLTDFGAHIQSEIYG